MRLEFKLIVVIVLLYSFAAAQGTPPRDPAEQTQQTGQLTAVAGTPPQAPMPRLEQMKKLIKTQVRRALDGKPYP